MPGIIYPGLKYTHPLILQSLLKFARSTILIFLTIIAGNAIWAQNDSIRMGAQFKNGTLKLRWSVSDPSLLASGFRQGYTVHIYNAADGTLRSQHHITPEDRQDVLPILTSSSDSLCFTLFEKFLTFSIPEDPDELQWQMVALLFGLQENFNLSKSLGMALDVPDLDTTGKFTIRIATQANAGDVIPAQLQISYPWFEHLPRPQAPFGVCQEKLVRVSGVMNASANYYSSYYLQKRIRNGPFVTINSKPLVINYESGDAVLYYLDSVTGLDTAEYRFYGKDMWGEFGPHSEVTTVLPCYHRVAPYIESALELSDRGKVKVTWRLSDSIARRQVTGYHVYRTPSRDSDPIRLTPVYLESGTTTFIDSHAMAINYYSVEALYRNGPPVKSNSILATLIDTKPPGFPTQVEISFDSITFTSELKWMPPQDPDLSGYRVYYSDYERGDKFLLTNRDWTYTRIRDTISPKTMQSERWYWITSRDFHGNESGFSDGIQIILPDRYPPTAPYISRVVNQYNEVQVHWYGSPSVDVVSHRLYRISPSDTTIILLASHNTDSLSQWIDTLIGPGDSISYQIEAADQHGLTARSKVRSGSLLRSLYIPDIPFYHAEDIDSTVLITFDYRQDIDIKYFRLMRGVPDDMRTERLYRPSEIIQRSGIKKKSDPNNYALYQIKLKNNNGRDYHFRLEAIENGNGSVSRLTEPFTVN